MVFCELGDPFPSKNRGPQWAAAAVHWGIATAQDPCLPRTQDGDHHPEPRLDRARGHVELDVLVELWPQLQLASPALLLPLIIGANATLLAILGAGSSHTLAALEATGAAGALGASGAGIPPQIMKAVRFGGGAGPALSLPATGGVGRVFGCTSIGIHGAAGHAMAAGEALRCAPGIPCTVCSN